VTTRFGRVFVFWLGLAITAAIYCGCGGDRGPERIVVSGTVTYNGKPLGEGEIRFMPVATAAAPVSGAIIKDGRYRVDLRGGVPVGAHKVQILAYRRGDSQSDQRAPQLIKEGRGHFIQYIPQRYNLNSELKITIEPGSKAITKDFDLTMEKR
jgi:hypothetical protein